ncbi:MAG TPA: hypothetical protein VN855_00240 [Candidatus Acidoferrum sp.]|nr:hypothetical protein [Candidatus Acidoferrum sp.]
MKILFYILLSLLLVVTNVYANCDWTAIKKNTDGTYVYTESLHLCVGQLVQDSKTNTQIISDLTKALSMKDLALKSSDQRANLWNDTSEKLEARLQKVDSLQKQNEFFYFICGIGAAVAVGYVTAKLVK